MKNLYVFIISTDRELLAKTACNYSISAAANSSSFAIQIKCSYNGLKLSQFIVL